MQAQQGVSNDDADLILAAGNYLIQTLRQEEEFQHTVEVVTWGLFTAAVSVAIVAAGLWWRRK